MKIMYMKFLLFLFFPIVAFATTVRDRVEYEMQQIAAAASSYVKAHPAAIGSDSKAIAKNLVADSEKGPYLSFDKKRISEEGLFSPNGKVYLIVASKNGVCVLEADDQGNYNGASAKHYYVSAGSP